MNRFLQPFELLLLFVPTLVLTGVSHAGGSESNQIPVALIQRTLQSSVMFRGWETKSYGDKKPHDTITVITTPDRDGDIIILRWDETRTQFQTELYRQESSPSLMKSWESGIGQIDKSIVQQPGGALHVVERISGPEGGERIEIIKLD